jgi:hypothetical protein
VLGKIRVSGLGAWVIAVAVACGSTGHNPNQGQTGGSSGAGASASSGNGGSSGNGDEAGAGSPSAGSSGSAAGGTSATGGAENAGDGAGGEAEVPPKRIEIVRDKVPNKLDLLMMIDNSISMGDKQHLLADAMERLVGRLVQPRCLDEQGAPTGERSSPAGVCPLGSQPEFLPFTDIHAGVVTSSLGSHGAADAKDVCTKPTDDDHAQLLGVLRPGLTSWNQKGFLAWDPPQKLAPVGIAEPTAFAAALAAHVQAAGDHGCGYESSLEGWYRFLVDPEPPAGVVVPQGSSLAEITGTSADVLAQRQAFLRPDSVLGIVMLSDENDCSIVDEGYGWLLSRASGSPTPTNMFRSTSQCLVDPNSACCQSCGESTAKAGCPPLNDDVECLKGKTLPSDQDYLGLRCFDQKRRFGFDLLYPVQRYIDGLTQVQIARRSDGALVPNPIYESRDGAQPRSPEQVLLLGIVGVPWQDIADASSLTKPGLKFLSEDGPLSAERWSVILGEPNASPPVPPSDPFMVESWTDRTASSIPQANPITGDVLVASTSQDPQANHINGHEAVAPTMSDLQLACIFPLANPIVCDTIAQNNNQACDCYAGDASFNRALCQPPSGGPAGTTQYFGKAYPSLRELSVLRGIGGHGIVASTCPKTADVASDSYGYRPAMDALAGRVARQIGRSCLRQDAKPDATGRTACGVLTASSSASCACPSEQGLAPAGAEAKAAALEELKSVGYCGPGMSCESLCVCELAQLSGAELTACQTADQPPSSPGFCYLNAVPGETNVGKAELAHDCVGGSPRRIRFTGGAPAESSIALLYCPE